MNERVIDNEIAAEIVRAALNIQRIKLLGFHVDDAGSRVFGDRDHQTEIQQYRLTRASRNLLISLTENELDPPWLGKETTNDE